MELIDAYSDDDKIIYKEREDIIYDIGYKTKEDRDICDMIIDGIEAIVSDAMQSNRVASIPLIGAVWRDRTNDEFLKDKDLIREKKNTLNRADYVKWVTDYRRDLDMKVNKEQSAKYKLYINRNKKKLTFKMK